MSFLGVTMQTLHFEPSKASAAQTLLWPSVLRTPPAFIGRLCDLPVAFRGPQTLKVAAISLMHCAHRLDQSEVVRQTALYLRQHALIATDGFFSEWVLLWGEPAGFAGQGVALLDYDQRRDIEIGVIEGAFDFALPPARRGNFPYADVEELAHGIVGAQLYQIQFLMAGFLEVQLQSANAIDQAYALLDPLIDEFRPLMRARRNRNTASGRAEEGMLGPDDYVYRYLVRKGRTVWFDLFGREAGIHDKLVRMWKELAFSLKDTDPVQNPLEQPVLRQALDQLEAAFACAKRAHQQNANGARKIRLTAPNEERAVAPKLRAKSDDLKSLLGSAMPDDDKCDIYRLTRLAFDFDFDALLFWPQLERWRVHFAIARWIGVLHRNRTGEVDMGPDEHWGLRGLLRSAGDEGLDPATAQARKFLRRHLPEGIEALDVPGKSIPFEVNAPAPWDIKS